MNPWKPEDLAPAAHPALEAIYAGIKGVSASIERLKEFEAQVDAARQTLRRTAESIGEVDDRNVRLGIVRYIYWCVPEVPAESLAKAMLFNEYELRLMVGPLITDCRCGRCSQFIVVHSRTRLAHARKQRDEGTARFAEGYVDLCDDCEKQVMAARRW